MTPDRLFETSRQVPTRRSKCRAIVLTRRACLTCGDPYQQIRFTQGVLFVHGGYGAPREDTFDVCHPCGVAYLRSSIELHPRTWR